MPHTRISFVGDISLNGKYDQLLCKAGPNYPFELVKSQFDTADLVVGNLESPLVPNSMAPPFPMKTPLRANPEYVKGLKWAGIQIVNLSNNHILDYGEEGANVTQTILDQHGLAHFGYGENLISAKEMRIVTVNSQRVGFIGYTDVEIDSPFYATQDRAGIARFRPDACEREIAAAKTLVDTLVVSLHWGIEYFYLPTPLQITNARRLIEHGADLIIGHHPHALQGIERYKHGIVAYSLGNFAFSEIAWQWHTPNGEKRITKYPLNRPNRKSAILTVSIGKDGALDYETTGTYLGKDARIRFAPMVSKDIQALSRQLTTKEYPRYFSQQLLRFRIKQDLLQQAKRLPRFYKLRTTHFREILGFLRHVKGRYKDRLLH